MFWSFEDGEAEGDMALYWAYDFPPPPPPPLDVILCNLFFLSFFFFLDFLFFRLDGGMGGGRCSGIWTGGTLSGSSLGLVICCLLLVVGGMFTDSFLDSGSRTMVPPASRGGVKGGGGGGASGIGARCVAASKKYSSFSSPVNNWARNSADLGEGSNGSKGEFGMLLIFFCSDENPSDMRINFSQQRYNRKLMLNARILYSVDLK